MGADVLATQGARTSATMIATMLNRINSVPAHQLTVYKDWSPYDTSRMALTTLHVLQLSCMPTLHFVITSCIHSVV